MSSGIVNQIQVPSQVQNQYLFISQIKGFVTLHSQNKRVSERSKGYVVFVLLILGVADLCRDC